MAQAIQSPSDCCSTCEDPIVENLPGPQGATGTAGTNGTDGVNAYTVTTASFVVPAVNSNVIIAVENSAWMGNGQKIFIQFAGYYEVQSVPSATSVIVKNLGYDGNTAPAVTIPTATTVSPAGIRGADGSLTGTAGGDLEGTYPDATLAITTTKGDLIVNQNAAVAPRNTRLGAGGDGTVLHSDSTQATGLVHRAIDLTGVATSLLGELPVANGGTGANSAANARTNLSAAKSGSNADITELTSLTTDLTVAQGGTGASSAQAARTNLGKLLPRYGLLGRVSAADINDGSSDNAITIEATRYRIDKVTVVNSSGTLATATAGVFTSAGGAGTVIAADQTLAAVSGTTKFDDLTLDAAMATDVVTAGTIYFRVGTPQGVAATADVLVFGWVMDV